MQKSLCRSQVEEKSEGEKLGTESCVRTTEGGEREEKGRKVERQEGRWVEGILECGRREGASLSLLLSVDADGGLMPSWSSSSLSVTASARVLASERREERGREERYCSCNFHRNDLSPSPP